MFQIRIGEPWIQQSNTRGFCRPWRPPLVVTRERALPISFGLGQVSQTRVEVIVSRGELASQVCESVHPLNFSAFDVEGGEVAELLRQLFFCHASRQPFPPLLTHLRSQVSAARFLSPHILETPWTFVISWVSSNVKLVVGMSCGHVSK